MLCKDAGVKMGITEYIPVERPITGISMVRQQQQDDSAKRRAQEALPELPQFEYWGHLEASISKLQEAMDQIKEEQNNQSSMLCKLLKEQEEQGRDLRELKRQKLILEQHPTD